MYVNFDPALVCLLRETKYFLLMKLDIPESAASIFDKAEVYRQVLPSPCVILCRSAQASRSVVRQCAPPTTARRKPRCKA